MLRVRLLDLYYSSSRIVRISFYLHIIYTIPHTFPSSIMRRRGLFISSIRLRRRCSPPSQSHRRHDLRPSDAVGVGATVLLRSNSIAPIPPLRELALASSNWPVELMAAQPSSFVAQGSAVVPRHHLTIPALPTVTPFVPAK